MTEDQATGSDPRPKRAASSSIRNDGPPFVLGICGGIILGALIDNMAIGLLLGFAVGFGLIKFRRRDPS